MGTGAAHETDARVGWLLKAWRQRSSDPRLVMQAPFAVRLAELAPHVSADASRVSRWESGRIRTNRAIVAGYERVLGLPEDHLLATVEGLWRDHGIDPREPGPPPGRIVVARGLDECVGLLTAGEHDGGTWHRLASLVDHPELLVYLPEAIREELSTALVDELPRSVGRAYARRVEAMRRMLGSELMQPHLLRAIGRQVTEPSSQAVVDLVANLPEVGGLAPVEMLVRLAGHETESVRTGALWGLGHRGVPVELSAPMSDRLVRTLVSVVDGDVPRNVDLALALADDLAATQAGPMAPVLRRRRAEASADAPTERAGVRRSAVLAMEALAVDADDVLRQVLEDAFDARGAVLQHEGWMLLMASPFRSALADHLVGVCAAGDLLPDQHAIGLTYLATESQRAGVEQLAARGAVSASTALRSVAHVPGADVPRPLAVVPTDAEMYALGMAAHPLLRVLASDLDAPSEVRGAARWWVEHGGAVHDPA